MGQKTIISARCVFERRRKRPVLRKVQDDKADNPTGMEVTNPRPPAMALRTQGSEMWDHARGGSGVEVRLCVVPMSGYR